jgi:hypothetical protein
MGNIKTTPQVGMDGKETGVIGLEITYGGKEAPFGGMDTSAAPAYIDPHCATEMQNIVIVNNKLVCVNWESFPLPSVLFGGDSGVTLTAAGSFYSSTYGTLNYVLGYVDSVFSGPPSGVAYGFYMTAWVPIKGSTPSVVYNDAIDIDLYDQLVAATQASITLPLLSIGSAATALGGVGATVSITAVTNQVTVTGPTYTGQSFAGIPVTVVINGGQGYKAGSTYYLVQGTSMNTQAAALATVTVNTVSASGAILTYTLNMSTYSYDFYLRTATIPGYGYSVGAASLILTTQVDVTLKIVNGASNNSYTVAVPALTTTTASTYGSGASGLIANANSGLLEIISNTSFSGAGAGSGYQVGQYYYVVSGTSKEAIIYISAIGVGGTLTVAGCVICTDGIPGTSTYVTSGTFTLSPVPYTDIVSDAGSVLQALVYAIDGLSTYAADPNVTASLSTDGGSIILTAIVPGTVGNAITVQDLSVIVGGSTPYYYFPCRSPLNLQGGKNTYTAYNLTTLPSASCVAVGGTLYIANIGPLILKYSGPGTFAISSLYQGVKTLKRFAGSLIGLGKIDPSGVVDTDMDMMFLWSAAEDLDIWAPTTATGNITGAGFAQLADIDDFLTGLIVSNNTAFIVRSQGLSYASALSSGQNPFQFAHIALGDRGEGGQLPDLICQYNESGVFIGNTDIYKVSGSLQSIGAKIRTSIFNTLQNVGSSTLLSSGACSVYIGGVSFPLVAFFMDGTVYLFVAENNTWGTSYLNPNAVNTRIACAMAEGPSISGDGNFSQSALVVADQNTSKVVSLNSLQESVQYENVPEATYIIFPQEEISFGRDITIEAIYFSYLGEILATVYVEFQINGVVFADVTLTQSSTQGIPVELKVFFTGGASIFTAHSPQLAIYITADQNGDPSTLEIVKATMFGSFDPRQRPV